MCERESFIGGFCGFFGGSEFLRGWMMIWHLPLFLVVVVFVLCCACGAMTADKMVAMKNAAILGGLFLLLSNGSSRFSVKKLLSTTKV